MTPERVFGSLVVLMIGAMICMPFWVAMHADDTGARPVTFEAQCTCTKVGALPTVCEVTP